MARERAALEVVVTGLDRLLTGLGDASELAELAAEEDDSATLGELDLDLQRYAQELEALEFRRMFGDELERKVTWKGNPSLSSLQGKPVLLRFALKDSDLFSFRFGGP